MTDRIPWEKLPPAGVEVIRALERAGHEAWFVGGCVRDLLMGRAPHDWDICTSALPEQTRSALAGYRTHDTGLRHGTLLVIAGGAGYEVTTFRAEVGYSDHRHPDAVRFVRTLEEDLARRDFTVNAMAFHPERGLVDPFGGRADLVRGLIRAVGDPELRFGEDALRILRALRFAGRFSFALEEGTARAVHVLRGDLDRIARERVFAELKAILTAPGQAAAGLLLEFRDVFAQVVPEVAPLFDYDQDNPHHDADGWRHTARVVSQVEPTPALRLAALFHDVGKPGCCTRDGQGVSHFYGHNRRSAQLARQALLRLRCDNQTRARVEGLIAIHDCTLPTDLPAARRFLARHGLELTRDLLELRRADVLGQSPFRREEKLGQLSAFAALVDRAAEQPCWSLRQLALKGSDLTARGMPPGPAVGRALRSVLEAVMDGAVPNRREDLLAWLEGQFPGTDSPSEPKGTETAE